MAVVDIRTGKLFAATTTRRKVLGGIAGILAAGTAPAAFRRSALAARGVAMGVALPYDEELEYLESSGTQFIDSKIIPSSGLGYELDAMSVDDHTEVTPVGAWGGWKINMWGDDWKGMVGSVNLHCFGASWSQDNERYFTNRCVLKYELGKQYVNGTLKLSASFNTFTCPFSAYIFCLNSITGAQHLGGGVRLWSIRFYNTADSSNVFDAIPVIKNGVGYLYDKISRHLFANIGTGTFGYKKKDGTIVEPT